MAFAKATKKQSRLRMSLFGPSGSGKTFTALSVASAFGRIAVIDTERGSASKYADLFDFDVLELNDYGPQKFVDAIKEASGAGYNVLVIDSLSHAWSGTGGVLELVDRAAKRSQSNNKFVAWGDVTPLHNQLIDTILTAPIHIIATMRSKTEYVLEKDDRGRTMPRKVGLAPVQRDGMEYEFDVVGEMNMDNELVVSKSRAVSLNGAVISKPGAALGETLKAWLSDGATVSVPAPALVQKPAPVVLQSPDSDPVPEALADAPAITVSANGDSQRFFCQEVYVQLVNKNQPGNFSYVARCHSDTGRVNIVSFSGDAWREAGYDVEGWKQDKNTVSLTPPADVYAHKEGGKWVIDRIVKSEIPF